MTRPTLITRLTFLFPYSPIKTIQAFSQAGFPYWRIILHFKSLLTIIDRYKRGSIDSQTFKTEVCTYFPGTSISEETFFACWNAGITIDFNRLEQFYQTATRKEIDILITSDTNPAHINYIQAHITAVRQQNPNAFPGLKLEQGLFSYQQPAESQSDLMQESIRQCRRAGKPTAILVKQPSSLTWMQWLNPLQHYFWSQAWIQYEKLSTFARENGCILITWPEPFSVEGCETMFEQINTQTSSVDPLLQPATPIATYVEDTAFERQTAPTSANTSSWLPRLFLRT